MNHSNRQDTPRLIQKLATCSCGTQFAFNHMMIGEPLATDTLAQQVHWHGENQPVTYATLMGDESIRLVTKMPPRRIYVQSLCPDDCDCHDWSDDE